MIRAAKHQPIPRKRPIREVDAEFPSLPSFSLAAAQKFAGKSQEALLSVQQQFPANSVIV